MDIIDWDHYISIDNRNSFVDMINRLEDTETGSMLDILFSRDKFSRNAKLLLPNKYTTPCSHWTIEGQFKVAEYLYNEITSRGLI